MKDNWEVTIKSVNRHGKVDIVSETFEEFKRISRYINLFKPKRNYEIYKIDIDVVWRLDV